GGQRITALAGKRELRTPYHEWPGAETGAGGQFERRALVGVQRQRHMAAVENGSIHISLRKFVEECFHVAKAGEGGRLLRPAAAGRQRLHQLDYGRVAPVSAHVLKKDDIVVRQLQNRARVR